MCVCHSLVAPSARARTLPPHHVRLPPVTLDVSLSDRTTPSTDFFFLNNKIKGCFLVEVGSRTEGFWEDGFN